MYFIQQSNDSDCGFACLKMILAIKNKDKNYLYLFCPDIEHKNYSYKELIDLAKQNGLSLNGYRFTNKLEIKKEKNFPFIASIRNANHAVVIKSIKMGRVKIYDPSLGVYSLSLKKFCEIWDGTALLVESFEKRQYPFAIDNILSIKHRICLASLQIFDVILCALAIFFMDKKYPSILMWIFTIAFILLAIITLFYSFNISNKMDKKFESKASNVKSNKYYDYYINCEKLKAKTISYPTNFISALFISVIAMVIILLNGYINIVYIVSSLVVAIIRALVVDPYTRKKNVTMYELENKMRNLDNLNDYMSNVKLCHAHSKSYSKVVLIGTIIEVVTLMMIPVIMMLSNNIANVTYVLLYLCLELCLSKSLRDLLNCSNDKNDYHLLLSNFYNQTNNKNK